MSHEIGQSLTSIKKVPSPSSALMFFGIAIAGTAVLIQTRFLEAYLSDSKFGLFLAWNACFSIIGVFFASPLMTLSVRTWSATDLDRFEYQCVVWILFLFVGFALLLGSAFRLVHTGHDGSMFLAMALGCITSAFSAFQRGFFGGSGKWSLLAVQQVIEGFCRLALTLYLMNVKSQWTLGFISITIVSQALAFLALLPSLARNFPLIKIEKPSFSRIFARVLPIWSNAIGLQIAFGLPVIVSFIKSPFGESDVILVGLLFMLMRIPVSFAPSINAPKLAAVSSVYGKPNNDRTPENFFQGYQSQKLYYFLATVGSCCFGLSILILVFHIDGWIAVQTCIICSSATSLILISQSVTTVLIGINKMSWVLAIWTVGTASLLLVPLVIGNSPLNMSIGLLIMGIVLMLMHLIALYTLQKSSKIRQLITNS